MSPRYGLAGHQSSAAFMSAFQRRFDARAESPTLPPRLTVSRTSVENEVELFGGVENITPDKCRLMVAS
jgi:hypothetical protein